MQLHSVVISGGGTGGHVFPAIAIADEIKKQNPDAKIHFVGAKGKMEMEKVPAAGYTIDGLWISGIQRKLTLSNLAFPFKLISSIAKAKRILKKHQPQVVIGVGGYASGPTLRAAASKGIPVVIQEQNSFPGITNRWLAKKADKICVAYDNLERFFPKEKIEVTGNPVREKMVDIEGKKEAACLHFNLDPNKPVILSIGGSLGARVINDAWKNHIGEVKNTEVQVLWQCGKFYYEEMQQAIATQGDAPNIHLHQFIKEMDLAYAAADVVISRAGAIAVSEISLVHKPVILVPSSNVAEDHQTKNARALVDQNAALMILDQEAPGQLVQQALDLVKDQSKQKELSNAIKAMAHENATEKIVEVIKSLVT